MIAPKIVSYVTPTGRDYSGTTAPDLITEVPGIELLSEAYMADPCEICGLPRTVCDAEQDDAL